jgi:hypothetical protein
MGATKGMEYRRRRLGNAAIYVTIAIAEPLSTATITPEATQKVDELYQGDASIIGCN